MYLTAQHIQSPAGEEEVHVYLHLHGSDAAALNDPLSVPQRNPGRLVPDHLVKRIPPGGNSVLSYLDIIAEDALGAAAQPNAAAHLEPWWEGALRSAGRTLRREPLPWVVAVAGLHLIFSANQAIEAEDEYERLLDAAIARWARWREQPDTAGG